MKSEAYIVSNTAAGIWRSFFFTCFCISWIFGDEFQILCTQKNPLDSRRFLAMRSWVDFPDPSDPSTMMSVPGRSSVEKNISFFTGFGDFVWGDFLSGVAIVDGWVFIQYREKLSLVKRTRTFPVAYYIKSVLDTFLCTEIYRIYLRDISIFYLFCIYSYGYIFLIYMGLLSFYGRGDSMTLSRILRGVSFTQKRAIIASSMRASCSLFACLARVVSILSTSSRSILPEYV